MLGALYASEGRADIYHYNNVIIGDRAIGLGGAYAGVSDDASGVIYNPAGLAFAMGNDISGSANAYYQKKTTYKEIFPGSNFTERSEGFVPSFFGGIQKLEKTLPGLVAGFAVYSPDSEIKDQNDEIHAASSGIQGFHRTVKGNASTLNMMAAAAYRVTSNFSLGMGFGVKNITELTQEYQLSVLHWGTRPGGSGQTAEKKFYVVDSLGKSYQVSDAAMAEHSPNGTKGLLWARSINGNYKLSALGLEPSLGVQYVLGNSLVFGASARATFLHRQNYIYQRDQTSYFRFYDGSVVNKSDLDGTDSKFSDPSGYRDNSIVSPTKGINTPGAEYTSDEPFTNWPMSLRGGVAWFASPSLLMTFDVIHNTEAETVDENLPQLSRVAITNYAAGIEYYIIPSLPVRLGGFTNFDARPALEEGTVNPQLETIDYYGGSLYLTWAEASSQFGGGAVYQTGKGKANKTGSAVQQDVEANSLILAFSASHQL
jgi:long-chain fatty acid transport protein